MNDFLEHLNQEYRWMEAVSLTPAGALASQLVWLSLALYTSSLITWGWKREPGDYCIAHVQKMPIFLGIRNLSVFLCYRWCKTSKLVAVCENGGFCFVFQFFSKLWRRLLCYALPKLGLHVSYLQLKNKQTQAIYMIYSGKFVFVCLPTGFSKSICFQIFPLRTQAWPGWW